jgi:putative nucleotidyltransferase with HDIG domain
VYTKIKLYTDELHLGMYVSELDRAWIDTPFLFQGFLINHQEELEQLKKHCDFVFVDKALSRPEVSPLLKASSQRRPPKATGKRKPSAPQRFTEANFRQSLARSYRVYRDARGWIDTMLGDCRLGKSVDTHQARHLVTQLAEQVIQNADALVWLTHLKKRDQYTATHCINVCILALTFGRELGLDDEALHRLGLGALLHDIGKLRVPDAILNKPGRLTEDEFNIMMTHPQEGHALLADDHSLERDTLDIILHHHERLDGGGYPFGLGEEAISLLTRITTIVDVYDAVTSDRCYHDAIPPARALESLFKWAPGNYDVSLLESFIKCIGIYPIGSVVRLVSQDVGVVVASDQGRRLKPIVMLVQNGEGKPYPTRRFINLSSAIWERSGAPMSIQEVLEPRTQGIDVKALLMEELRISANQLVSA